MSVCLAPAHCSSPNKNDTIQCSQRLLWRTQCCQERLRLCVTRDRIGVMAQVNPATIRAVLLAIQTQNVLINQANDDHRDHDIAS